MVLTQQERESKHRVWEALADLLTVAQAEGLTKEEALICFRLGVKYFEADREGTLTLNPTQFEEFLEKEITGHHDHQRVS